MKLFKLLVFIAFTISSYFTFAQDFREKLNFGLKAGANYANVYSEEGEDFVADGKIGFAGGAFVNIPLGNFFAIQPEIMFSQKGFKGSGMLLGQDYSLTRTTNFIDVPLLLAIRPADWISIVVGPQFAFKLSTKNKYEFGNLSGEDTQIEENKNIRKTILGGHFGLDINIKHFVLSPRASFDFQDNKGDGTSTDPKYKNFLLQLTVGYRF